MPNKPKLLVVDDEAVICKACQRVFSRQGFDVEENTDAREGLSRAVENDYAGVLLDIKMPELDGIQFLEELRKSKPDMPVLIMTGYPSVPNASAAVRLGASDYITKPFTPEDITQSVQRMLRRGLAEEGPSGATPPGAESAEEAEQQASGEEDLLFVDEAWLRLEEDGSACIGAVLPWPQGTTVEAVRPPRIGEVVYQGLPLAGVAMADKTGMVVPSPISGVVVAVNERLNTEPSLLLDDPCGQGWIACVCTTRLEEELSKCGPRRVLLANTDPSAATNQIEQLRQLGCQVKTAGSWEEIAPIVQGAGCDVLFFDAVSFGSAGSALVGQAKAAAPSLKVVVIGPSASQWEAAYRQQGIFYYAVEPFADKEIVRILDSVFHPQATPVSHAGHRRVPLEPIGGIRITNKNGHKVQLMVSPGMSREKTGLGRQIQQKLADLMFPISTASGEADISPTNIVKAVGVCDRAMVLTAKDTGQLPGSLARDTKAEFGSVAGEKTSRVTTLEVQSDPRGAGFEGLDARTAEALAEHIVREMASY